MTHCKILKRLDSRAKYCQGVNVLPLSTERSNTHRSGRGELANLIRTYATWKSWEPEHKEQLNKRRSLLRADFGKKLQFPVLRCFYWVKIQLLGSDRFLISFLVKLWAQRQHRHCVSLKNPSRINDLNQTGFSCLQMVCVPVAWLSAAESGHAEKFKQPLQVQPGSWKDLPDSRLFSWLFYLPLPSDRGVHTRAENAASDCLWQAPDCSVSCAPFAFHQHYSQTLKATKMSLIDHCGTERSFLGAKALFFVWSSTLQCQTACDTCNKTKGHS